MLKSIPMKPVAELRRGLISLAFLGPFCAWGAENACHAVFYEPLSIDEVTSIVAAQRFEDTLFLPSGGVDEQVVHTHGEVLLGKLAASANLSDEQRIGGKYAVLNDQQIESLHLKISGAVGQLVSQPNMASAQQKVIQFAPEPKLLSGQRMKPAFLEGTTGEISEPVMKFTNVPMESVKKGLQRVIQGRVDYYRNLNLTDVPVLTKINKFQVALQDLAESLRKNLHMHTDHNVIGEDLQRWSGFFEKWVNGSGGSKPYDTDLLFCEVERFSGWADVQLELLLNVVEYGLRATKIEEKETTLARRIQVLLAEVIYKYHRVFAYLPKDLLQKLDQGPISLLTLDRFFKDEYLARELIQNAPTLQLHEKPRELAEILMHLQDVRLLEKHQDQESTGFGEAWISSVLSFSLSAQWAETAPELRRKRRADFLQFLARYPQMRVHAERHLTSRNLEAAAPWSEVYYENEKEVLKEEIMAASIPRELPKPPAEALLLPPPSDNQAPAGELSTSVEYEHPTNTTPYNPYAGESVYRHFRRYFD